MKYINSTTKITLLCRTVPEHGAFEITPASHLLGACCPKCSKNGWSKAAMEWLEYMEASMGVIIQHARNGGEYRIPNTRYSADGYIRELNMVLEFNGDYWHGNPNVFSPDDINTSVGLTFRELYQKTLAKKDYIESLGYSYISIWENDWNMLKQKIGSS